MAVEVPQWETVRKRMILRGDRAAQRIERWRRGWRQRLGCGRTDNRNRDLWQESALIAECDGAGFVVLQLLH